MKLNRELVNQRIRETKQPTYQASELIATLDLMTDRLFPDDHEAHRRRIGEMRRFIREHYGVTKQIDTTLIDLAAECLYAGLCEADGEPYEPQNARVAALLIQVKARLTRTATPEGEDLQAPTGQAIEVNGMTRA